MAEHLPRQIGRYRLLERLGAGGMGEVFLAEMVDVRRHCAVKLVLPHRVQRADVVEMFEREVALAVKIAHENVIQAYDAGRDGDALYLVMELVDGVTLRALKESKRLAFPEVCALIADVARGLRAIHSLKEQIVHRDVTPDNVLVTREGVAKIGDFGIAVSGDMQRLTTTGELKGKIPYMSPEQLDGADVTGAADVFSLGVTLYWLLAHKRPFDRATELATMNAIVNETPPRMVGIPYAVDSLVQRMLAKNAKERPSAGDVVDVLEPLGKRPAALVRELAGPSKYDLDRLDTRVVPMLAVADPATLPPTLPVTLPPPSPQQLPQAPLAPTTSITVERAPRSRVPLGIAAGVAVGLVVLAIGVVVIRPDDVVIRPGDVVKRDAGPEVAARDAGPAPAVTALAVASDAGVVMHELPSVLDAGAAEVIELPAVENEGERNATPTIELRGPASITWMTSDGKKLGTGNTRIKLRARQVTAIDGVTGAHCIVDVARGVARWDSVPTGAVDIRANPYAEVFVGSRDLGTTPIKPLPQLPACAVRLRFVYEAKTRTEVVRVVAGKTTPVRVDME